MKGKKILLSLAILSSLSLTLGIGSCNAPLFNLNFEFLDFFQSCAGMLPDEENNEDVENETNENIAEVSQYFKYTLNEDGKSYSVGFWSSGEDLEQHFANYNYSIEEIYRFLPQTTLEGSLIIPSKYNGLPVTHISEYGFAYCCGLNVAILPDSITSIGDAAFWCCQKLVRIEIGESVQKIGEHASSTCEALIEVYNKSSLNLQTNEDGSYGSIGYAENVYTPTSGESKVSIDENGYILYTDDNSVILAGYIGTNTNLILPDNITEIGNRAFFNHRNLESIILPHSVTSIDRWAFVTYFYDNFLKSIVIPSSVTSIDYVFEGCKNLTIYCEAESKPNNWDTFWNSNRPVYWYSESEPTTTGNYWHYDENGEIAVW